MTRQDFLYKHIRGNIVLNVGNAAHEAVYHKNLIKKYPGYIFYGLDVVRIDGDRQYLGSCQNMPFENETFDTVYMGEVVEHVFEPFKAIQEASRVLKSGGVLIIDTPNPYSLSRILRYIFKRTDNLGDPDHKMFFSRAAISQMLLMAGFSILEFTTENNFSTHLLRFNFPKKYFWHLGECYLVVAQKISYNDKI